MGLWDNTVKSLVTSVKHQYRAEDKKLKEGVERSLQEAPEERAKAWVLVQPERCQGKHHWQGPLQRTQAMNCDCTTLDAHPQAPAESGTAWFVPGLLLSMCIRPREPHEALAGAGWCFGAALGACPQRRHVFPWLCLVQAAGHCRACLLQLVGNQTAPLQGPCPARQVLNASGRL